jgi:hypothetical protein
MVNSTNYGGSIQNVGSPNLRIDAGTADAYTRVEPPKLTFMQKLGRGLAKTMGFLGPIGAAVSAVTLGPLGLPVAAGLYGLTKFSQDKLYQANIKDEIAMSSAQQQQQSQTIGFPGLFDTSPVSAGEQVTEFIAPKSLEPQISDVVVDRNSAQQEAVGQF